MSQFTDSGYLTEQPDGDIAIYLRVKKTATGVNVAGATDRTYGTAYRPGFAASAANGNVVPDISVKHINAPGTHIAIASAAIAKDTEFQGAAGGKIATLAGGKAIGVTRAAASGNNSQVEVFYYPQEAADDSLETFTDPGNAGDIDVTGNAYVELSTTGAETRTIGDPVAGGQQLTVTLKTDGGNAVVTADSAVNQTGNNTLTFADAGDTISLVSIADGVSAFRWSVLANDGVALSTV